MGEMTNEQAVRWLKDLLKSDLPMEQYQTALEKGIEVLEQDPCEDAISRQAVLDLMADYDLSMGQVVKGIHTLPPVIPQPKIGYWIRWYEQKERERCIEHIPHCKCSECGKEYDPHSSQFIKYCSYCGAKMVESEEKNDAV